MSVEQEVANLTSAINTLTSTVNVRKAVLDAAVDEAGIYADQALGYKNEAAAKAIEAIDQAANAGATKALMDAALANVTNYDNTLAQLTGGAKRVVAQTDVVAAFVYDTTKDSDRGAWRKRCRQTSWYNEALNTATRGARREFPKKALIVARAGSVTIHDMDDAACPMWMVFSAATTSQHARSTAVSAAILANGILVIGGNQGVARVDFIRDFSVFSNNSYSGSWTDGRVVSRNGDTAVAAGSAYGLIAAIQVNGVAATVLPGTPVDKRRGLPTPTVAVATAGGVSVIHWGWWVNSYTASDYNHVAYAADDWLWASRNGGATLLGFSPTSQMSMATYDALYTATTSTPAISGTGFVKVGRGARGVVPVAHPTFGLNLLRREGVQNRGMIACVRQAYNTGFMIGDIKLALAESTADVTSLVAYSLLDDFSSYADDTALNAVYTSISGATLSLDTGRLKITNGAGAGVARRLWANNLTVGQRYEWAVDLTGGTAGVDVRFASTQGGNNYGTATFTDAGNSATRTGSFVAISSDLWIDARTSAPASGTGFFDNFRLKAVASDRSVAGNHPTVVGTVTRAAVASGAELAAYGGFSASDYLERAYHADFDMGTGDFAVCGWFYLAPNSAIETILERDSASTGQRWTLNVTAAGLLQWIVDDNTTTVTSTSANAVDDSRWHHFVVGKRGANQLLWIDGVLVDSDTAPTLTLNNASAVLRVGESAAGGNPLTNGRLAIPRITKGSMPTPAQIRAMYEAERGLFEANAKCLLVGSDNVQGLAYDDSTDLLYVAKAAGGTDVFKGLVRVETMNIASQGAAMTSDNHKAVHAGDGHVSIVTAAEAFARLPSVGLREASLGHNGGPPLYDRTVARQSAVTTNATPTVIARFPMDKGERGEWIIRTHAKEYADGSEMAAYEDVLFAHRPDEGNIAISGSSTQRVIQEVTGSMAVTIAANTTTQCIEVTATGVAAKNIEWSVEGRLAA